MPDASANSVIHDLGYQRYDGPRLGRAYTTRTLYLHSLRTAFGLGRGVKAKLFIWSIAGIIGLVGLILTVIRTQTGEAPLTHPEFVDQMAILSVLFLAIVAPELASRDQQTGVLALYFARPLRREDYALARLAGVVSALWLVLAAPQVVMVAGAALSGDNTLGDFLQGLAHAAIHAILLGSLSLMIASLLRRRAVAAAAIVGVFLVATPIVAFSESLHTGLGNQVLISMVSPPNALIHLGTWLFTSESVPYGPLLVGYVIVVSAACVALLLARYRKVGA
jgi:ABC-2 type transport system permease protein